MTAVVSNVHSMFSRQASHRSRRLIAGCALALMAAGAMSGCTSAQLQGQSSSYLIIDSLEGASGAEPDKLSTTFSSDVQTLVKRQIGGQEVMVPTVYEDAGRVTFRLGMKNPGTAESPTAPTSANYITVNRYNVRYVRADGRNTPGVDVPYPFDGAITMTVGEDVVSAGLTLVRLQAKLEQPLRPLVGMGGQVAISTLAEVTFYGHDQAGREVSAMGRIGVTFADWGDPE